MHHTRNFLLYVAATLVAGCGVELAPPAPLEQTTDGNDSAVRPVDDGLAAWPDPFADAEDCEDFQNYPDVPPYEGPADHCGRNRVNPGCPDGVECEIPDSGWEGPYNIYADNCHDAANCGVEAGENCEDISTGILSCTGNTSGLGGHTVNYTVMPYTPPEEPDEGTTGGDSGSGSGSSDTGDDEPDQWLVCLSEPQHSDPDATKCCWLQDSETPQTGDGDPGHACYEYRCGNQANDDGGEVLPPGECWPTPSEDPPCDPPWSDEALECCQEHTKRWDHALPHMCRESSYDNQVDFRCDVYVQCVEAAGWPPEGSSSSDDGSSTDDGSEESTSSGGLSTTGYGQGSYGTSGGTE